MKSLYVSLIFAFCSLMGMATHNRAGEITYRHLGGRDYHVILTTYTNSNSQTDFSALDIDLMNFNHLIIETKTAIRINGSGDGELLGNGVRKNIYEVYFTVPGDGKYIFGMYNPNRNDGVVNIPNSVNTPFYIESYLHHNQLLKGGNNSPLTTYMPLDSACLYSCFYHNPGAYDTDGDSLSFKIAVCAGGASTTYAPVAGYSFPPSGQNGQLYVDPLTGDFTWCSPQPAGFPWTSFPQEYNFAMMIEEWRRDPNGLLYMIGYVIRDFQVEVNNCNNRPPQISAVQDTCVLAGSSLTLNVSATDPDSDLVTFSATGGVFQVNPPALFDSVNGIFTWNTACDLVRKQPYQVLFRAIDNDPANPLIDLESVFITIIAPAPTALTALPECTGIRLSWDTASCDPVNNKVKGYKIYMDDWCNPWAPGACETGVPSYSGYTLAGTVTGKNNTSFIVNNLIQGIDYSFHVVTEFMDGALSLASVPVCLHLKRDVPVLTNVDVISTSQSNGTIDVKWVKPQSGTNGLDTLLYPGPYKYILKRSSGYVNPATQIAVFTSPDFSGLNNVSYADVSLNTEDSAYVYGLEFYYTDPLTNNFVLMCSTRSASSVYLSLTPGDNTLTLNWTFNVPWSNTKYYIWKEIPAFSNNWVKIDSTSQTSYVDDSLVNGSAYCYYVESSGGYSDQSLPSPLLNKSERKCGVPADFTPPCPPALSLVSDCILGHNTLSWTNPNLSCCDDVVSYNLYFSPLLGQDPILLMTISPATNTTFLHDSLVSIAGCYFITAVDSFGNESQASNIGCADNCPLYELPNVFTPNGDGVNDIFMPLDLRNVDAVDIQIYNRWGAVIFQTTEPKILWDGKEKETGKLCSDGVYFYVCRVYELHLEGLEMRTLQGFVHLLQGK